MHGAVALHEVLDTGRYDADAAARAPGWARELGGEHTPETEEFARRSWLLLDDPLPAWAGDPHHAHSA